MTKYELGVILKPSLTEEQKVAAIEKVKGFITKVNGEITNVDDWGKKELAYEIAKVREGYYTFIKFNGDSEAVAKIEYDCRIADEVIRFMTVVDDFVEAPPRKTFKRQPRKTFNKDDRSKKPAAKKEEKTEEA